MQCGWLEAAQGAAGALLLVAIQGSHFHVRAREQELFGVSRHGEDRRGLVDALPIAQAHAICA
jgi:hypothetical protein